MSPLRQMVILFHGLMGLSIGFFSGSSAGILTMIVLSAGGCAFGLLASAMMCYMPRMIRSAAETIPHNRLLASALALAAHLVWIGVAVCFWWVCITLLEAHTVH